MRRIVFIAWSLATAAFGATVDGHVVNSVTGAGIPAVSVKLMRQELLAYSATTDAQGRFQIADVEPGTYKAEYRQTSKFVPLPSWALPSEPPFQVSADGTPVHLEVKLPPLGELSGKVLDSAGVPIPFAMATLSLEGHRTKLKMSRPADAKGEYRFDGLPFAGEWVVSAMGPIYGKPLASNDDQRLEWAQTYYPGVTDPAAAVRIVLPQSGELSDLDFKLKAVPAHRIRGVLLDVRGDPVPGASVGLGGSINIPQTVICKDDGTFEFASVGDGARRLSATVKREGVILRALQDIEINGHDLDDVKVELQAPFSIHGGVAVEVPEGAPAPKLPTLQVVGNQPVKPNSNGDFIIDNLYPGPFFIRPESPPPGYYLDSIRIGNSEALETPVQILSGDQPLTVTYKHGGGTIRGTVEKCGTADVTLVPREPAQRHPGLIRRASCDPNGKFEILSVRPGEYYAFALPAEAYFSDFEPLDSDLVKQSTLVTVVDNELVTPEIRLVGH